MIDKLETMLKSLGLWKSIQNFPALFILIIACFAVLEGVASQISMPLPLLAPQVQILIALISALLGLIGYFGGEFWDSKFFDPYYSLQGKWLDAHTRPFHIFPAGSDLKRSRDGAIKTLSGTNRKGEGIYKIAKEIAEKQPSWKHIEAPLILSKFVRGFIWPCFVISAISFLVAIISIFSHPLADGTLYFVVSAISLCFGILLFVPYFHLRVEHMIRLYDFVSKSGSSK